MTMVVRSKVVKIGNSRGIRIPRTLLEQAGLAGDVEMSVEGDRLVIQAVHEPRQGWAAKMAEMTAQGDDKLFDSATPTEWDEDDWTW